MKIVVVSKTGSVGKTVLSAHFFKSMMPTAQLFSIEDMNQAADALGVDVMAMNGGQFGDLLNSIFIEDEAIIDVGMSNVRFFLDGMRKFEGSCNEFDYFVVPLTPDKRAQEEACETIITLLEIGVEPSRIRPIYNKVPTTFFDTETFGGFVRYVMKNTSVKVNSLWAVEENPAFEMLSQRGLSLAAVVADARDYKGEARAMVLQARADGKHHDDDVVEAVNDLTSMHSLRMCCVPLMDKFSKLWGELKLTPQVS